MDISPAKVVEIVNIVWKSGPAKWQSFVRISKKTTFTRLRALTLLSLAFWISWIPFNELAWKLADEEARQKNVEQFRNSEVNNLRYDSELITLCATSTEKGLPLRDYYCRKVAGIFESASAGQLANKERVADLISHKAYEGMVVDIAQYVRNVQSQANGAEVSLWWVHFCNTFLSPKAIVIEGSTFLAFFLAVAFVLLREGGQFEQKKELEIIL